jgi:hypothetical protein
MSFFVHFATVTPTICTMGSGQRQEEPPFSSDSLYEWVKWRTSAGKRHQELTEQVAAVRSAGVPVQKHLQRADKRALKAWKEAIQEVQRREDAIPAPVLLIELVLAFRWLFDPFR